MLTADGAVVFSYPLVFLPFVTGYFLSYFFRNVNAVIAKDLAGEFALGAKFDRAMAG